MSAAPLYIWVGIHLALWAMTYAWTTLIGESPECAVAYCKTPLEGVINIFSEQPSIDPRYIVGLVLDFLLAIWGLLTVNYELFGGTDGSLAQVISYSVRLIAGLTGAALLILIGMQLLFGRR